MCTVLSFPFALPKIHAKSILDSFKLNMIDCPVHIILLIELIVCTCVYYYMNWFDKLNEIPIFPQREEDE